MLLDVSDVALDLQRQEAQRRGLTSRVSFVHADAASWAPPLATFAATLATSYWDRAAFLAACAAVRSGGLLAWETFSLAHLDRKPAFRPEWCLAAREPASLLPADWELELLRDLADDRSATRRMVARRELTSRASR